MSKASEKTDKGESRSRFRLCSSLPTLHHEQGYTQSVCGLLGSEARRVGSRVGIVRGCHCVRFASRGLSLRGEPSPAFLTVLAPPPPRRSGSCTRGVRSWIWRREWRRAGPYLLPHLPDPLPALWDWKPVLRFLHPGERARRFCYLPEEVDVESVEYSLLQSPQYEELLEVVTRAVAKLNIDWPAEKQAEPQKSKLDERFLRTKPLPPRRSLPFFPDLYTEVSRS